jgi:3-oxoacyl-[acyl-carrier protein] reductase
MSEVVEKKVALVTGGSRGIGRSVSIELAKSGVAVAVNYVNHEREAQAVVDDITKLGADAIKVKADISDGHQVSSMMEAVRDKWGRLDILVNNAGLIKDSLIARMKEEDWDYVVDVNLKGTFLCTKAALRYMVKQKWGRIVNVSSVVGQAGNPGQSNYGAAKAGLVGFTRSVAKEVGSRDITLNVVAPGYIQTDAVAGLADKFRDFIMSRVLIKRLGTTDDVSKLILFLCSDEAGYITGQVINVDGGLALG